MGNPLRHQRRGKGSPAYRTPKHRFYSDASYSNLPVEACGEVTAFKLDPSKSTPLAEVLLDNGKTVLLLAAEGLCIGDQIEFGGKAGVKRGNVCMLGNLPDGVPVFNVELHPNDGGRLLRSSGTYATVLAHDEETNAVTLKFASSSKVVRILSPNCRATAGIAAGGGRKEKPFKKAGSKFHARKACNKDYPKVRGTAMNAYSHPHGGKSFGKSSCVGANTPPGRRVGHIRARQTGRRKRRERTKTAVK
ncbi:50S ribosomal protein L2 [Candidatus Micrarchaeota archaeon CG_4_10_14_0_2_um_filter_55_9]|nr:MAG: 50S ribosomal protein L2 [Candidatus Micrarchaeota archaeon CG1_02_55_41]PIO02574.1 MAG: 50S ribosomal protein L2 [Candidatus Micrarchaeota archaeon CG09_land_8_20_14_0_10_55_25]PIZ91974.1 MAG: 50S ribosomal protein L2 [Candidatus Micrarchaeota archaeon CG_4_10_14_0_2_um_filter_55_9]PJD01027.1 MAG: 50S ribosomal protein L2 [Candidatus Micrarchaeota archaeon CG10_big_fil_rev_8_21_14_0_10_54_18]